MAKERQVTLRCLKGLRGGSLRSPQVVEASSALILAIVLALG